MITDDAVITRLQDAVSAYTENTTGAPDSLDRLLLHPQPRSHGRSALSIAALTAAVAASVAAILFLATTLHGPASSSHDAQPAARTGVTVLSATRITTPTSKLYPASSYAVVSQLTKLTHKVMKTRPVIVHTPDLAVVHPLPLSLMGAQLTADGTKLFGYYLGDGAGCCTANSDSTNPAVKHLVGRDNAAHAVYLDFATGDLVDFGRSAWPGILGMSVTPDGHTVAYTRWVKNNSGEHSVIRVVDLVTDKWREFTVPLHHQSLGLALSPDGKQLAFTETETSNILFMADLSQRNPAATARAVIPRQPCRQPAYDYPTWIETGLYAVRECVPDANGMVAAVVRIDPGTLQQVGAPVAPLPDGGVATLAVANGGGSLQFLYMTIRSAAPYDNGDMTILFRNNELWQIRPGETRGHRTGLLWGW